MLPISRSKGRSIFLAQRKALLIIEQFALTLDSVQRPDQLDRLVGPTALALALHPLHVNKLSSCARHMWSTI